MTQTISEYTPKLVDLNYEKTSYDPTLEMQLLVKRQQEYDTTLQRINNLKSTSMNVLMLNKQGQDKLDNYNKELHNMLSQDLGDLTDTTVQAKVSGYFNAVANDTDLKMRSKHSQHYKTQLDVIEAARNNPNPEKSGYNEEHEVVFKMWEGGLNDFYNAGDITNWDQKKISYTPYKDLNQRYANIVKLAAEEEKYSESQTLSTITDPTTGKEIQVPNGNIIGLGTKGRSAEKIRKLFEVSLTADERAQFRVQSQYRIIQNFQDPAGKKQLYDAYSFWNKSEQNNTQIQLAQIQGQISQFDPAKLDKTLPDYETRKVIYEETVKGLEEQKNYLIEASKRQVKSQKDWKAWENMSMNEMLPYINQMTVENYVNGMAEALSTKSEIQKIKVDEAYYLDKKMGLAERRLDLDTQLGFARLAIEQQKLDLAAAKKSKEGSIDENFDEPTDAAPTTEEMVRTFDDFKQTVSTYGKKVDPILTEKNEDGSYKVTTEQLQSKAWKEANKDNYQVKLYEQFAAMNHGGDTSPAAFEAFLIKAENGDFANEPLVQSIYDQYNIDKDISNFLDEKAAKIAGITSNTVDLDMTLPGGQYSLKDYAKAHNPNWKEGDPVMLGVKDQQGRWKSVSLESIFKDLDSPGVWEYFNSDKKTRGQLAEQYQHLEDLFISDPNLSYLIKKVNNHRLAANEMLQNILVEEMPNIYQFQQRVGKTPEAIESVIGEIQASVKLANPDVPIAIPASYIDQVGIPSSGASPSAEGYYTIKNTKEAKEGIRNNSKTRLKVHGSNVYHMGDEIQPGVKYSMPIPPEKRHDNMTNWMFQDKGVILRSVAGHKVKFVKGDGSLAIHIDGQIQLVEYKGQDITQIVRETEAAIRRKAKLEKQAKPK